MKNIVIVAVVLVALVGVGLMTLLFSEEQPISPAVDAYPYIEIADPAGFVNTNGEPVTIEQYVGEKVILLDIMTYSCINCQRTFPYITSWYETYKDDGFVVIGIHTPEFAFEKDIENVEAAMERFGISYPVVLDNNYGTWRAYGNRYWPRKYLIDIHGNIVYDHIGEGAYEETEREIQKLLAERAQVLGDAEFDTDGLIADSIAGQRSESQTPETYFGSLRNEYLGNKLPSQYGVATYTLPDEYELNLMYLGGSWNIRDEAAVAKNESVVMYRYNAKEVYIVASSDSPASIEVWQDGERVNVEKGADVNDDGVITVEESRLYKVIDNDEVGEHLLELRVEEDITLYAFTFG